MEKTIGFEVRSISNQIKRYLNSLPAFQSNEVRGIYGYVMGFLYKNSDRDIFQKDIEEELSIRRSSVTNLLGRMESCGLIERQSVSGDARLKKVVLTEKAIQMQEQIDKEIKGVEERLSKGLTEREKEELFKLLAKVRKNVEEFSQK
ncbi:MAG: MarR family transcriptional regulator [Clostridia bacterium]|nr:MarR family transcriptional regulator [Clostridia bacterium]